MRIKRSINEVLAQRTGQSLERIEKDTDRDFFMTAHEAKEYGLIDKVIEPSEGVELKEPKESHL